MTTAESTGVVLPAEEPDTFYLKPVSRLRRYRPTLLSTGAIVLVLLAWQVSSDLRWVDPLTSSSPKQIGIAAWHFIPSREGLNDMKVSGEELLIGLCLATVVGIGMGLLMGWYGIIEETLGLGLSIFYSLPLIALAPVIVLWFGIGISSKVVVVFIAALFPILVSTMSGVKGVDPTLVNVARTYNAGERQLWLTVLLPGAVPSIITGIRLGMANALIGVVVGEFIASSAGVGFLISQAANNFNVELLFVGLLILGVVSVILNVLLRRIERRFSKWRST